MEKEKWEEKSGRGSVTPSAEPSFSLLPWGRGRRAAAGEGRAPPGEKRSMSNGSHPLN
jgi:hypothetical protein